MALKFVDDVVLELDVPTAPKPKSVARAPSPISLVKPVVVPAPSSALGTAILPSLTWGMGPAGKDSTFAFQPLGWPWARQNGADLFKTLRLSAIGDGSCFYHAAFKNLGILRDSLSPDAPFLADPKFVASLDYLDVDYRDPDALLAYVDEAGLPLEKLPDTYTRRQYLVDQWRNDAYRWLLSTAIKPDGKYYTEAEAITALNNDPRNLRAWINETVLNPAQVHFVINNQEATNFLDLLIAGGIANGQPHLPNNPKAVYTYYLQGGQDALTERINGMDVIIAYMSTDVANNQAVRRIETAMIAALTGAEATSETAAAAAAAGWDASLYTKTEAVALITDILDRAGRGFVPTVIATYTTLKASNFYDQLAKNYTVTVSNEDLAAMLANREFYEQLDLFIRTALIDELKVGNPGWYLKHVNASLEQNAQTLADQILNNPDLGYVLDDIPKLQEPWKQEILAVGTERLIGETRAPYLILDTEVKARLSPDYIRLLAPFFFDRQNWGRLATLVDRKTDPLDVLVFIDRLAAEEGASSSSVKALFRRWLRGDYLRAIEGYIDYRFGILQRLKDKIGLDPLRYRYEPYASAYLDQILTSGNVGWQLIERSINRKSGTWFLPEEVAALKERDPRKIIVHGHPLAALYQQTAAGTYEPTDQLDPLLMQLKINANYFMADLGFHLRTQVYESNLRSIASMLPVNANLQTVPGYKGARQDAGEDILPWFSRMMGFNLHVVQARPQFTTLYRTYTSGDLNTIIDDSPHIVVNNTGNHYESFGLVGRVSNPPVRDDIVTVFTTDTPFIAAVQAYPDATTSTSLPRHRLTTEEWYQQLVNTGTLVPSVTTPNPEVEITSLTDGEDVQSNNTDVETMRAILLSLEGDLPLPGGLPSLGKLPPLPPFSSTLPSLPPITGTVLPNLQGLPPLPDI